MAIFPKYVDCIINEKLVASLIGLYKNNRAVCWHLFHLYLATLPYRIYWSDLHKTISNHIAFCHGQILIETATYSLWTYMKLKRRKGMAMHAVMIHICLHCGMYNPISPRAKYEKIYDASRAVPATVFFLESNISITKVSVDHNVICKGKVQNTTRIKTPER